MSRFDYIAYDEKATGKQSALKEEFMIMEQCVRSLLPLSSPHIQKIMEHLECAYMWCGKAIRDDQIMRTQEKQLKEERNNG